MILKRFGLLILIASLSVVTERARTDCQRRHQGRGRKTSNKQVNRPRSAAKKTAKATKKTVKKGVNQDR